MSQVFYDAARAWGSDPHQKVNFTFQNGDEWEHTDKVKEEEDYSTHFNRLIIPTDNTFFFLYYLPDLLPFHHLILMPASSIVS